MNEGLILSFDLSLRSSGLTAIDLEGKLKGFDLITSSADEYNDEDLLHFNAKCAVEFVREFDPGLIRGFALEGLSLYGKSGDFDLICGNFWFIRATLKQHWPSIPLGVIPVASWRAKVLSKQEQRDWKKKDAKLGLKLGVVDKLPLKVREEFELGIKARGIEKWKKEKNPIFDAADSYFLGQYRLSLEN